VERSVIVGVERGQDVVGPARVLAKRLGARLVLVHAIGPGLVTGAAGLADAQEATDEESTRKDLEQERHVEELAPLVSSVAEAGVETVTVAEHEDPAELILRVADENPGALIVIGRHRMTRIGRYLLGGVAEAVLEAGRPVVVLPLDGPP